MKTLESLAQTVEDVKTEVVKDVFKRKTINTEELLDVIEEGIRKFIRTMLEIYAKDEFLRYIGARPYERTDKRKDYRNGSLHKTILTPFGPIEDVNIPRGRKGGFVPKVIERFKAFKIKIAKIVVEMFTLGISTRKIKRITKIIAGNEISKTEASRLNQSIKSEIAAWLNRPINKKFSYLFIDGIFLKIRRKIISKEAILCAVGITESGQKEFLGFLPGGRESRQAWEQFLTHLVRRGLDPRAVKLIISDGCPGMIRAIKTIFPYSDHQHCLFHKMFNLRAKCPRSEWPLIKAKIHKIYFALNERDARENAKAFIKEHKDIFPKLVDCIKKDLDSCIAYMKHPFRRWKHIRTTNIIERGFKEVKRRVKVMETFPTEESCIRILFSLLRLQNEIWEGKPLADF